MGLQMRKVAAWFLQSILRPLAELRTTLSLRQHYTLSHLYAHAN